MRTGRSCCEVGNCTLLPRHLRQPTACSTMHAVPPSSIPPHHLSHPPTHSRTTTCHVPWPRTCHGLLCESPRPRCIPALPPRERQRHAPLAPCLVGGDRSVGQAGCQESQACSKQHCGRTGRKKVDLKPKVRQPGPCSTARPPGGAGKQQHDMAGRPGRGHDQSAASVVQLSCPPLPPPPPPPKIHQSHHLHLSLWRLWSAVPLHPAQPSHPHTPHASSIQTPLHPFPIHPQYLYPLYPQPPSKLSYPYPCTPRPPVPNTPAPTPHTCILHQVLGF